CSSCHPRRMHGTLCCKQSCQSPETTLQHCLVSSHPRRMLKSSTLRVKLKPSADWQRPVQSTNRLKSRACLPFQEELASSSGLLEASKSGAGAFSPFWSSRTLQSRFQGHLPHSWCLKTILRC